MHKFSDGTREWEIDFSLGMAAKLKEELSVDVLDGGDSLTKLATDPYTTANVLYVICEEQATKAEISDEQFGHLLKGDVIDDATQALLDELVDFFPKRQRAALRTMLASLTEMQDDAAKMGAEKLGSQAMKDMMSRELSKASQAIDRLMAGDTSGSVQALSATAGAT